MTLTHPTIADLVSVNLAIQSLEVAQGQLRALGIRRAATMTAQAIHSARTAEQQIRRALKLHDGDSPL
jgi:hypothetical protein